MPVIRADTVGPVTLVLADCLYGQHVGEFVAPGSAAAIITDTPYCSGGFTEASRRTSKSMGVKSEALGWFEGDNMTTLGLQFLLRAIAIDSWTMLRKGGTLSLFMDWRMIPAIAPAIESARLRWQQLVVWDKKSAGLGNGFRAQHETLLHFAKGVPLYASAQNGNVLSVGRPRDRMHPTEKPVDLLAKIIETVAEPGALIVDWFGGAGSVGVAAIASGRRAVLFEVDPVFHERALERCRAELAKGKLFTPAQRSEQGGFELVNVSGVLDADGKPMDADAARAAVLGNPLLVGTIGAELERLELETRYAAAVLESEEAAARFREEHGVAVSYDNAGMPYLERLDVLEAHKRDMLRLEVAQRFGRSCEVVACSACKGSGDGEWVEGEGTVQCTACNGSGYIAHALEPVDAEFDAKAFDEVKPLGPGDPGYIAPKTDDDQPATIEGVLHAIGGELERVGGFEPGELTGCAGFMGAIGVETVDAEPYPGDVAFVGELREFTESRVAEVAGMLGETVDDQGEPYESRPMRNDTPSPASDNRGDEASAAEFDRLTRAAIEEGRLTRDPGPPYPETKSSPDVGRAFADRAARRGRMIHEQLERMERDNPAPAIENETKHGDLVRDLATLEQHEDELRAAVAAAPADAFNVETKCKRCAGDGWIWGPAEPGSMRVPADCPRCGGSGNAGVRDHCPEGHTNIACPACAGRGELAGAKCATCSGFGQVNFYAIPAAKESRTCMRTGQPLLCWSRLCAAAGACTRTDAGALL